MKKRKKILNSIITISILIFIISIIFYFVYINSDFFKLKELGYTEKEILDLRKYFNDDKEILESKDKDIIIELIKQKYYIFDNNNKYIEYYNENKDIELSEIISIINTNRDNDFYTNIKDTDIDKGILMLINKYYKLSKDYAPNLINMSTKYAYSGNKMDKDAYEYYVKMCDDLYKEKGLILKTTSSYRSYITQENLYNYYVNEYGKELTDTFSARAGHSEHQTGLSLDIISDSSNMGTFNSTEEYKWLKDNSYKYGFILRYDKNKINITGYKFEPWHYRFVGVDVATYIYENDISFDEYYAYFIENK